MVKKLLIAVGGVTVLTVFFFGRDAVSYVGTSVSKVQDWGKDAVPVEFEIERARKMVADLVPDIRKSMHVIAKEEVEVERLESQIATNDAALAKAKQEIVRLRDDVSSPRDCYTYNGKRYTVQQVKLDLANRFERYQTNDATLQSLREILDARQRSLQAARQKLDGMLAAKRQLEVDVENLEARMKMVQVAQTASDINVDDSNLARTKDLIAEIRTRLDVASRLVSAEGQYTGEINLDEPKAENIVEQVTEYFDEVRPTSSSDEHLASDLSL
jgi:chromosome segregation ATPase